METTIVENQMEKKMENEMETGIIMGNIYNLKEPLRGVYFLDTPSALVLFEQGRPRCPNLQPVFAEDIVARPPIAAMQSLPVKVVSFRA